MLDVQPLPSTNEQSMTSLNMTYHFRRPKSDYPDWETSLTACHETHPYADEADVQEATRLKTTTKTCINSIHANL